MSFGGGSGSNQQTTQLDPQIKGDWQNLYNMTTATAGQAVPQQQVAGLTSEQQSAISAAPGAMSAGQGATNSAITDATNAAGFKAPQLGLSYDGSSILSGVNGYGAANASAPSNSLLNYSTVNAPQVSSGQLDQFLNPYTNDVYNTSLQQLDLARQQAINQNSSDATLQGGEGAWGGARAGVSDSLTNTAFANQAANTAANLNSQGFNTALSGLQNQQQMGETAQEANQNAGLTAGTTAYGGQLSTALANQSAQNTAGQFNAGAANTASMYNAGQTLNAAENNASNALTANQQQLTGANLLGNLGSQQQSMYVTGLGTEMGAGQVQQQQQQQQYDTAYQNLMNQRNLPIQTVESAFGIIPNTGSGSSTSSNSTGKSGSI
jgi:hypothetical protein